MHVGIGAVLWFAIATAWGSAEPDNSGRFIGSWKLVSYELQLASGSVLKPFGDHPIGRILYERNGQMSAQLMRPQPTPFADTDPLKASQEEADRAWRSYIGYWGTFTVDTKAGVVIHQIEGGWFPNWMGQKQIRSFRFRGDELILEADSPAWRASLVWRRID
jgi:hypothetical protein